MTLCGAEYVKPVVAYTGLKYLKHCFTFDMKCVEKVLLNSIMQYVDLERRLLLTLNSIL